MAGFLKNLFDKKDRAQKVDIARRFELLSRVGQGSMSKVWRAKDAMTGKMLAVKVLDKLKTERFEARFVGLKKPSEGEISISLQHVNVVKTLEHGMTTTDEPYLVMEFVEGVSLSYLVDVQNEQMQTHCLNYVIQLGEAISYLHRQNWIHRDLCPRNVMVDQDNVVKLIDFGLVVPNTPDFQKPGNRTGTANYMAPELIKRQRTDQRIDIYSFSVTAYEMYARRLPWDVAAQETLETVLQHMNKPPTPIKQLAPNIHPLVAETLMKGLLPNPDQRWQTIDEMLVPLRKAHEEIEAKRALERRKKAASAKVKSAGADSKAKAKKTADDDAFVDMILKDEAVDTGTAKKSPKGQNGPSESPSASSKPVKKNSPVTKPTSVADADDDFDGIEIEVEGTKLDEIKPAKKTEKKSPEVVKQVSQPVADDDDEFDGIEIEVEGHDVEATSDDDDEFAGIEIEEEGELPIELPATPTVGAGRKLAMLFDDDDDQMKSGKSHSPLLAVQAADADDDEPVLRLPDDDDDTDAKPGSGK